MREKIWEYKNKLHSREDIVALAKACNIPPAIAVILMNRGLFTEKDVRAYMKKSLEAVHNPFMLDGAEDAADRIASAIDNNEKIVIYGDYDVDGITATSILYKFLKSQGANVQYYIPDRFSEGYGINVLAVSRLSKGGTKLLITVDCGISAVGEVELAKTLGMDVIITDHHTCREELPKATAVINPKRQDSSYPFAHLAGVGVAFKLVLALAMRRGMNTNDVFRRYVDLAAIGTIADVVPLLDENRVIADRGIKAIENTQNVGIKALLEVSGMSGKALDSTAIGFFMAPRINAAGRLENARIAVELMTSTDEGEAHEIAEHLNELNIRRKDIEQDICEEALAMAEAMGDQLVYVLSGKGWNHGVIGIVASRIMEKFYRPCILISVEDGKGKGSGRSVPEMNLFDALADSEELLTAFGGHSQAAGLSISEDKIDEFRAKINAFAKKNIDIERLVPKIKIDCSVGEQSVSLQAAKMLSMLEPYGEANEVPVFSMTGLRVLAIATMGNAAQHLRMRLSGDVNTFNAVGFGMGEYVNEISVGDRVSVCFNMSVNTYQGTESLQLVLKDIKK